MALVDITWHTSSRCPHLSQLANAHYDRPLQLIDGFPISSFNIFSIVLFVFGGGFCPLLRYLKHYFVESNEALGILDLPIRNFGIQLSLGNIAVVTRLSQMPAEIDRLLSSVFPIMPK